jgi:hypothetical protein
MSVFARRAKQRSIGMRNVCRFREDIDAAA